jgi:predicted HD superfamily hydrolase involved in NAD metabolism
MPVAKSARYKEYLAYLRDHAPEQTVSHCVFTAEYLSSFAGSLGVDHDEAIAAGLLHDLLRQEPGDSLLAEARALGIPIDECHCEVPMLLHGPVAAHRVRSGLNVPSEAVFEAIYWHTTGRPKLGMLGRALYVADFSEPTRRFPQASEAREILRKEGFLHALKYVARCRQEYLKDKDFIDPTSQAFYLWLTRESGA